MNPIVFSSHLSARRRPVPVPAPVQLIQHFLFGFRHLVALLRHASHTHHQDLLAVRRLARDEGVVLQVHHLRHVGGATAAPPAPRLPQQGGSQQDRAQRDRDAGREGGGTAFQRGGLPLGGEGMQSCAATVRVRRTEQKVVF